MTVSLQTDRDIMYPLVRIMVMPQGNWTTTPQPWVALSIPARLDRAGKRYYGRAHGYELDSVEQALIPTIGAAVFHLDFGSINGIDYNFEDDNSPTTARDLLNYDVRIQLAPAPADRSVNKAFVPAWKTVFLGTVIAQEDSHWADDQISASLAGGGRRTYRCADLLWRTQRWPMNRHTAVVQNDNASTDGTNPRQYTHSYGHPGYNYAIQGYYRRLFGNRWNGEWPLSNGASAGHLIDPFGDQLDSDNNLKAGANLDKYLPHSWAGAGTAYVTTWNDMQVVDHAFASSRASGEPCFRIVAGDNGGNATGVLQSSTFSWPVSEGESCWDFISRVLARQRSRGLARLWWTDQATGSNLGQETDPNGSIYPFLAIYPQFLADISFTPPGASPVTFYGANTCGTTATIDLAGDHRVPKGGILIAQNATTMVDYLESFGEPIEVLVTLSPGDGAGGTLAKRWTSTEETAFAAIPSRNFWQRTLDRWKYVWQRWSLPPTWDFQAADGAGGSLQKIAWYCDDSAALQVANISSTRDGSPIWSYESTWRGTPSPLTCKVLSDLPLYEGHDYTSDANTRYDAAADSISPPRLPPIVLARDAGGSDAFFDPTTVGAGLQVDDFGILVATGDDLGLGTRSFSTDGVVGNVYGYSKLVVTVGLQFSSRVRVASALNSLGPTTAPRRKSLFFPGIFLWIADSQAIWRIGHISSNEASPYMPPTRAACGGTPTAPGLLRDDRASLLSLHNLAWSWYSVEHRTAQWEMRDCGLLPSFTSNDANGEAQTIAYPQIGQFVTTLTGDSIITLNTPVTRVVYANGLTTWFTDWCDLDQI